MQIYLLAFFPQCIGVVYQSEDEQTVLLYMGAVTVIVSIVAFKKLLFHLIGLLPIVMVDLVLMCFH